MKRVIRTHGTDVYEVKEGVERLLSDEEKDDVCRELYKDIFSVSAEQLQDWQTWLWKHKPDLANYVILWRLHYVYVCGQLVQAHDLLDDVLESHYKKMLAETEQINKTDC